jgi:hypothetical protein
MCLSPKLSRLLVEMQVKNNLRTLLETRIMIHTIARTIIAILIILKRSHLMSLEIH